MKSSYIVTGLMSGTSLDGVDLVLCKLQFRNYKWGYKILDAITIPYPSPLKNRLAKATTLSKTEIERLDIELGTFFARELNTFHHQQKFRPDIIASHGHTIFHDPNKKMTLQIGNGKIMADQTGITVVNNFRQKDVEYGGQGAPLVPVGDRLLFGSYDICLNIGGIANISFEDHGLRRAYDICPVNMVLNYLTEAVGREYDTDGLLARSGRCNMKLFSKLNNLAYYRQPPPKSLGKEWFYAEFKPLLDSSGITDKDRLATSVEHIALQMSNAIKRPFVQSILITGGGALNQFLLERIHYLSNKEIKLPSKSVLEFKEGLVFALLGILRIRNEINCYASVTGASTDLCTGDIIHP